MTSPPPLWGCAPEVKVDIAEMRRRCYEPETGVLRTRDGGGGRCGSEQAQWVFFSYWFDGSEERTAPTTIHDDDDAIVKVYK
ncbi:unnamed protein product [Brassica oleracea]